MKSLMDIFRWAKSGTSALCDLFMGLGITCQLSFKLLARLGVKTWGVSVTDIILHFVTCSNELLSAEDSINRSPNFRFLRTDPSFDLQFATPGDEILLSGSLA